MLVVEGEEEEALLYRCDSCRTWKAVGLQAGEGAGADRTRSTLLVEGEAAGEEQEPSPHHLMLTPTPRYQTCPHLSHELAMPPE